ncbi:MAG TPA: cytochrome c [Thermomicrobiales bacterium]|nr:cytochrome c [Thermomicrobiales bacterium]
MIRSARQPRYRLLLLVLVIPLVLSACGGGSGSSNDDDAGDSDQTNAARDLFAAKGCADCHGPDGEGTDTAPNPLAGTRMIIQQFQTRVRNGRGSAMPAYTPDQISDEEIRMLYDWLRE